MGPANAFKSRLGSDTTWRLFNNACQKNRRGPYIRTVTLDLPYDDSTTKGDAMEQCEKICAERPDCCMVCTKNDREFEKWRCYLYSGRFGTMSDKDIKGLSFNSTFEDCEFKDTEANCEAEPDKKY